MTRRPLPPRAERLAQPDPRDGAPLSEAETEAILAEGGRHFDAGAFFESHEAWEAAWHRAPASERDFFRGLIHAAAACLHHVGGNRHGFDRQVGRMHARLAALGPRHRGIDLEGLKASIEALPPPGDEAVYPRLARQRTRRRKNGKGEGGKRDDPPPRGRG